MSWRQCHIRLICLIAIKLNYDLILMLFHYLLSNMYLHILDKFSIFNTLCIIEFTTKHPFVLSQSSIKVVRNMYILSLAINIHNQDWVIDRPL